MAERYTQGTQIGPSRCEWFAGDPVTTPDGRWMCPSGDGGEMVQTGTAWPMSPMGWHHRCSVCGFTAAPQDGRRFPTTEPPRQCEPVTQMLNVSVSHRSLGQLRGITD